MVFYYEDTNFLVIRVHLSMTMKIFSLVELIVVLSIIFILSAMLMPMLNRARETAKSTSCKGNMKQSLTALVIYLDTYEVVSTQRWTDTLIATGLVSYPQISALRSPSWIRERDTHKNVFGMRRIIGDAHTLHITGSPSDYVLLADSLNLDTLQQFINFYGNWGPHKLVVHYRHHRKANAGFATREETTRALRMLDEVYGLLYEVAKR